MFVLYIFHILIGNFLHKRNLHTDYHMQWKGEIFCFMVLVKLIILRKWSPLDTHRLVSDLRYNTFTGLQLGDATWRHRAWSSLLKLRCFRGQTIAWWLNRQYDPRDEILVKLLHYFKTFQQEKSSSKQQLLKYCNFIKDNALISLP